MRQTNQSNQQSHLWQRHQTFKMQKNPIVSKTLAIFCSGLLAIAGIANYFNWKDTVVKAPLNSLSDVSATLELGGKLKKEKKYDEAKEQFQRALEIAPNDANVNAAYAGLLIEIGDFELAAKHLATALQSDTTHLDATTKMGHLQSSLGNFDASAKCYETAVQISPNDEDLQSCLIASLIRGGNLSDAERFGHANLELRPNSAKANVDYASVLVAMSENNKAIEYCEKAIALDERLSTAHATLATLEPTPEKAIKHISKAIELDPLSADYNQMLGDMLMPISPKDAIAKYEIALNSAPNSVEILLKLGAAWDACGQPAQGIPFLERVTKLFPDWEEARQSLETLRREHAKP